MGHLITAKLTDIKSLATAVKDLEWYTGGGGYVLASVSVDGGVATWILDTRPVEAPLSGPVVVVERRRMVEPGDEVVIETKGQQMSRRLGGVGSEGMQGVVFRVLTQGPHPHGMKVELRDRTVGRVKQNLTVPGAGEPRGR